MSTRPEPEVTATEAARLLGVHRSRIYQLLEEGALRRGDAGGITLEAIEDYQDSRRPAGRPRKATQ